MATPQETVELVKRYWRVPWVLFGEIIAVILVVLSFFWALCVNFVDNYELGYLFDARNGKITILNRTGYFVTMPLVVSVRTVDMRPMQVCINANQRVLNCKLIQFDPKGIELFLSWHGRKNYAAPSGGTDANGKAYTSEFSEILKSYAYEGTGKNYPFLRIIRDLKPEDAAASIQK